MLSKPHIFLSFVSHSLRLYTSPCVHVSVPTCIDLWTDLSFRKGTHTHTHELGECMHACIIIAVAHSIRSRVYDMLKYMSTN